MSLVSILALLAGCSTPEPPAAPEPQRPNLLLFTLDTLRADAIGVYGGQRAETPTLDGLAEAGVRFDRAYTVTPLTIPAHSSLFTGLYPPRHGVQDNGDHYLGSDAFTLAERLRKQGYDTMAAVGAEVTSRHWGFNQGFDAYYDDLSETRGEEKNRWRVERRGDEVIADALGWFDKRGEDADPWFSWVHLFDVHHPYEAPEPFASKFPFYAAEVSWTDSLVGQMLDQLEASGQLENTWVVVMADHGEGLGSHGEGQHGTLLYDATTRIPLIIRPPGGLEQGRVVDTPVSLVDIAPTLAELGGATTDGVDGVSLVPVLDGAEGDAERQVYVESLYAWRHYGWAPQKALVSNTHKLIDSSTDEFYDREDRAERHNRVESQPEPYQAHLTDLRAMTEAMVLDEGTSAAADATDERMEMLEALGYITTTTELAPEADPETLPHPKDMLPVLKRVETVRSALRTGDFAKAEEEARKLLTDNPELVDLRLSLAQALVAQEKFDEAITVVSEVEESRGSAVSKTLLGNLMARKRDYVRARQLFQAAVDQDPNYLGGWQGLLPLLHLTRDLPALERASAEALTRIEGFPLALGMQGVVLLERGDASGEALVRQALDKAPETPALRGVLGASLRTRGEYASAEELLLDEVRLHPPGLPARRHLVALYAETGRYAEQLEQLGVVSRFEPPNVLTRHSLAQVLFNLERYDDALKAVQDCRTLAPEYPHCALLEANALLKLGRETEARAVHAEANRLVQQGREATPPAPTE